MSKAKTCGNCDDFSSEIVQFMNGDDPVAEEKMRCNFFDADILCEIEDCPCWKPKGRGER